MKLLKFATIGVILGLGQIPIHATPPIDYGVFYSHELIQTMSGTYSDYTTGEIAGSDTQGPYSFGAFDHVTPSGTTNSSSVLVPPSSSPYSMVFTTDDSSWNYHSTGVSSLATVTGTFPSGTGTYSIQGTGPSSGSSNPLSLNDGSFPNVAQVMSVTGPGAQWLDGKIYLDPASTSTISWAPFTGYTNGGNISVNVYDTNGTGGKLVMLDAFNDGTSGDPTISSLTFTPGELNAGDLYVASISYVQFTDLSTDIGAGGADVAGDESEINFYIFAVPETNNFWLAGIALAALGFRSFSRRSKAGFTPIP